MSSLRRAAILVLLFAVSLAALSFAIHTLTAGNTLGGDYLVYHLAGQAALRGENPYGDAIGLQVQQMFHKQLAGAGEDQTGFAYPPFALFIILPLVNLPFDWAAAIWMAFLVLSTFLVLLSAYSRGPRWVIFSLFLLFPFFFGVLLGNFNVLITAVLVWLFARFTSGQANSRGVKLFCGILLAWTLIKPQFSWAFAGLLLLISLRRREYRIAVSFALSLLIFLGSSFLLVPGWPSLWLESLQKYSVYNQTWLDAIFFARQFLSPQAANVAGIALLVLVAAAAVWLLFAWWKGKTPALLVWGWMGLAAFLVHPRGKSYEHLVFLIPILTWLLEHASRRAMPPVIFWGGSLVLSWAAFYLQRFPSSPPAVAEFPFLLLPLWLIWLMKAPAAELPATAPQNPV